jgi:hypothetical protein
MNNVDAVHLHDNNGYEGENGSKEVDDIDIRFLG